MVYWYIWYLLTYLSLNRGLLTTYTWKIEGILLAVPDGTMKIYWKLCVQVIVQPDDEGPGYDVSSMLFNCSLLVVNKGQRSLLMSQPATSWMSFFANFLMAFARGRIRWRANNFIFNSFSVIMHLNLLITKHFVILLYHVCGMYKSNCNFGAGCSNWAVWADLRFGFVHSTNILE